MTDEKQDQERADRNHERSEEAHWQVAEAGAEKEDRQLEAARQSDKQKDDWENEGGALDREPRKTTEQGDEIPVPKLGNLEKVSEPERKQKPRGDGPRVTKMLFCHLCILAIPIAALAGTRAVSVREVGEVPWRALKPLVQQELLVHMRAELRRPVHRRLAPSVHC